MSRSTTAIAEYNAQLGLVRIRSVLAAQVHLIVEHRASYLQ